MSSPVINQSKLISPVLRWHPDRELLFVLFSWFLVIGGLSLAFRVFTTKLVALNFIMFGPVTIFALGILIPLIWTLRHERRPNALGLTPKKLGLSLLIGLILSVIQYSLTLAKIPLPPIPKLIPFAAMALTVGLFEATFFRGWIQLRMEESFGWLPAITIGAGMYALYHIGYGMTWNEIGFLFFIGLIYGATFRLTKNIFAIWPLFTPLGGLFATIMDGLSIPFEATYGFVLVLGLMISSIILVPRLTAKKSKHYRTHTEKVKNSR